MRNLRVKLLKVKRTAHNIPQLNGHGPGPGVKDCEHLADQRRHGGVREELTHPSHENCPRNTAWVTQRGIVNAFAWKINNRCYNSDATCKKYAFLSWMAITGVTVCFKITFTNKQGCFVYSLPKVWRLLVLIGICLRQAPARVAVWRHGRHSCFSYCARPSLPICRHWNNQCLSKCVALVRQQSIHRTVNIVTKNLLFEVCANKHAKHHDSL